MNQVPDAALSSTRAISYSAATMAACQPPATAIVVKMIQMTTTMRLSTRAACAWSSRQCNAAGQVVLNLNTQWRDGTTHRVMSPPEVMQ
jgi:hypothetical protein